MSAFVNNEDNKENNKENDDERSFEEMLMKETLFKRLITKKLAFKRTKELVKGFDSKVSKGLPVVRDCLWWLLKIGT